MFYLGYVLGPGSHSLLDFVWCPQLLQNWEYMYRGNTIDHWRNPAHQAKDLGTTADPWIGYADFYVCFIGRPYLYDGLYPLSVAYL